MSDERLDKIHIENMTWKEAQIALREADFVILPCGATEQHSTHLPLSVDTIRATELTSELARAGSDRDMSMVVLPTLPYGESEHHMNFPGTITLTPSVYEAVLTDIGRSVQRHGADRFLIANFHGGNRNPIERVAKHLIREIGLPTHYIHWSAVAMKYAREAFGDDIEIHSSEVETSTVELYRPDLVRAKKKERHEMKPRPKTRPYAYIDDITERGGLGDPTRSNPSKMKTVIEETIGEVLSNLETDIRRE